MKRRFKFIAAVLAAAGLVVSAFAQEPVRYEAEDAEISGGAEVRTNTAASGGEFVRMGEGDILFNVTVPSAGFYTITASYSNTYGSSKTQDVYINGTSAGTFVFGETGPDEAPPNFEVVVVAGKINLNSGANTIEIRKNWGWMDIDYIEVGAFMETPFNISQNLVTPNASVNTRKMYQFLRDNFQQKIISGVMTGYSISNTSTYATEAEVQFIHNASGKYPALLGLDVFMGTGQAFNADFAENGANGWYSQYNQGVLNLAEEIFNDGGIPHIMWHWRDPTKETDAFYSLTGSDDPKTDFDFSAAFLDAGTYTQWNTNSAIYDSLIADIDRVAGYLQILADKDVPVLWRPLHEAAGGWFWWGRGKKPAPLVALWKLMFERLVNHHQLDNLIWMWTCEEGADALAWYPGDEYVDIITRDYYDWTGTGGATQNFRPGSLILNFENLKSVYGARKMIALGEVGTVPHPDSLIKDGAGWSFFMVWNTDFVTNGVANPATHWNAVMNHDYVLTLDDMPGWDNVQLSIRRGTTVANARRGAPQVSLRGRTLSVAGIDNSEMQIRVINLSGKTVARFNATGGGNFSIARVPAGKYVVDVKVGGRRAGSTSIVVR